MSAGSKVSLDKVDLGGVLKRFLSLLDARQITISTSEGAELLSETRTHIPSPEDSHTIMSLAPSFHISMDQSSRLQLGAAKYAVTWAANSIIMQIKVGSLVLSILLEETANLGIADELVEELQSILRPFCNFES